MHELRSNTTTGSSPPVLAWVESLRPAATAAVCAALIAIVAAADSLTPFDLRLFILYFFPIAIAGWGKGTPAGLLCAFASGLAWSVANYLANPLPDDLRVLFWNIPAMFLSFLAVAYLIGMVRRMRDELLALAMNDPLTGLLNRRGFEQRAADLMDLLRRNPGPLAMVYLDVDNFKAVNDARGHSGGDDLLRAVGRALAKRTRRSDVAARVGGDEFAVLLNGADETAAAKFCRDLQALLLAADPLDRGRISVSIGAACFDAPPSGIEEFMEQANRLMFETKRGGKSGTTVRKVAIEA
ncbi:MAG: GGDEF domain-containing protein [Candidatus Sumerlaeia bacterium]|nr:GGDEF domain-containing protein [Candidatus Sumerlaeia bacterium]